MILGSNLSRKFYRTQNLYMALNQVQNNILYTRYTLQLSSLPMGHGYAVLGLKPTRLNDIILELSKNIKIS